MIKGLLSIALGLVTIASKVVYDIHEYAIGQTSQPETNIAVVKRRLEGKPSSSNDNRSLRMAITVDSPSHL